jgi:hypothetical protein
MQQQQQWAAGHMEVCALMAWALEEAKTWQASCNAASMLLHEGDAAVHTTCSGQHASWYKQGHVGR